jgi:DNA mismatch repair protein MutL
MAIEAVSTAGAERRVRVLPDVIANQIAAGEVVERPASVVKELVENSLDAGAGRIAVELEQAGTALIAVVDDGEGLSRDDAVCAFSRHATSKLTEVDDLLRISTLGFRGEALASIGAVGRTTMVTRRRDDLAGTRVVVQDSELVEVGEAGAPTGTRIEVADLFANTPARRKFLKAPATEVGHVSELLTRLALAWPHCSFRLTHNGRVLLDYGAVEEHGERIRQVLRSERANGLLGLRHETGGGVVHGWISNTQITYPSQRQIFTYVNRRYVRDKVVTHALMAGYSTLLMHGRYPAAVVFVEVPFDEVDVNVHPAKSEVRFRRSGAIHDMLVQGVQKRLRAEDVDRRAAGVPFHRDAAAFAQMPLRPVGGLPLGLPAGSPPVSARLALRAASLAPADGAAPPVFQHAAAPDVDPAAAPRPDRREDAGGFFANLRILGQVFGGYLIGESDDQLVLIDQHAAHERVMFERLADSQRRGMVPRQRLLVPVVVDLGPREAVLLREHLDRLAELGFEVEPHSGDSFAVRAVPALLGDTDAAGLVRDLAEDLVEIGRSRRLDDATESILSRLACHSAVRVGQGMSADQVRALLRSMDHTDFSGHCPHGRPSFIALSRGDFERWFKRT